MAPARTSTHEAIFNLAGEPVQYHTAAQNSNVAMIAAPYRMQYLGITVTF